MNYKVYPTPLPLKAWVQRFWTLETEPGEPAPKDYFLMADSCPEIIFQYNEGFDTFAAQSARIRFQHSICDHFRVGKKIGFFGLRLYPHAVRKLLRIPSHELTNRVFDFSDAFPQAGADLADQVYAAKDARERIALVSGFLAAKTAGRKADPLNHYVDQICLNAGAVDIAAMQRESGLSLKQFERRFKAMTGFPPKFFARLARFQAVKDRYPNSRFSSMTSLAYSCNYYDQAHFNREFREFSGVQPRKYFRLYEPNNNLQHHSGNHYNSRVKSPQFDGYLPCGWFV